MRCLFDQNLSHRLVALLAAEFPGSQHVRDVGMAADFGMNQKIKPENQTLKLSWVSVANPEMLDQSDRHIEPLIGTALVLGGCKRHFLDRHQFFHQKPTCAASEVAKRAALPGLRTKPVQ